MIFQQLFDTTSSTFTYVLAQRPGGKAIIIDPVYEQVLTYIALFRRLNLKLEKALDTHVHADHITGLGALRDLTKCVTVAGERSGADVVSMRVKDGEVIETDGLRLTVMHTPGHTDDSYCFVMGDRVFTGDTLLIGGTGRTDFQNGDPAAAWHSLFDRLLKLPDDTLVFPGHDYNGNAVSTIGYERIHNPRLQAKSAEEYARLMATVSLESPKMMDVAVPANRSIGRSLEKFVGPGEQLTAEECLRDLQNPGFVLIDLREEGERRRDGAIPGSLHMPYGDFEKQLKPSGLLRRMARDRSQRIVLYCAFGERSALALHTAREAGLEGVRHLDGGMAAWLRAGGQLEFPE